MGKRGWRKREAETIRRGVEAEVSFHLEARVEDLVAGGMTEAAARGKAEAEFGDIALVRAELEEIDVRTRHRRRRRDGWGVAGAEMRRAARAMVREPAFFVVGLITLTLGLAGAAAIFTLLDGIVLRPLPYASSERLIRIESQVPGVGVGVTWGLAKGEFLFLREQSRELASMGLYRLGSVTVASPGRGPERVMSAQVEPGVATVLGVEPRLGRMIETRDNLESDARIALVSERWLERHPEARPGSILTLDGTAVEIVGVLPANAVLPEDLEAGGAPIDLWLPLWLDPSEPARNTHLFRAIGLLAEGSDAERAGAELARLTDRLTEALPSVYTPGFMSSSGFRTVVRPLRSDVIGGIAQVLWMLLGAVGIVLTIAAANVANLFLVRAEGRRRETAVRTALGAGRGHLLTSFCAETLLLAVLACAMALPLAAGAVRVVTFVAPQGLPRLDSVSVGASTAGFVVLTGLVVGLGLGLVPFARRRLDLSLLRGEGRAHTADRRSVSARSFLVITQFTLALILLSSAALLLRSFLRMRAADPGLDGTGVHTFSIHVPATARYSSFTSAGVFQRELTERAASLPSVESASLTDYVPLTGAVGCTVIFSREVPRVPDAIPACVTVASVGPDFFTILGIPVRGGVSNWTEMQNGIGGAVVSESLARRLWPGRDAIGMTIRANNPAEPYYRVIGVAGDVHGEGIERPPVEAVYFPLVPAEDALISSAPPQTLTLILRAGSDPPDLPASVRAALAEIAPDAALGHVQSMGSIVAGSTARVSFAASLLLLAALIALTLSAVGIYGVMGFLVRQRQAEIGVRMALGASASQVWRMIVRQSLAMAGPGIALGLVLAWVASNALRSFLFEVEPGDPFAIGIAATTLLAVAVIACTVPARRAASIDPAHSLHGES